MGLGVQRDCACYHNNPFFVVGNDYRLDVVREPEPRFGLHHEAVAIGGRVLRGGAAGSPVLLDQLDGGRESGATRHTLSRPARTAIEGHYTGHNVDGCSGSWP